MRYLIISLLLLLPITADSQISPEPGFPSKNAKVNLELEVNQNSERIRELEKKLNEYRLLNATLSEYMLLNTKEGVDKLDLMISLKTYIDTRDSTLTRNMVEHFVELKGNTGQVLVEHEERLKLLSMLLQQHVLNHP